MTEPQTLSAYFTYCKLQKNLDNKTLKAYQIDLKQFVDFYPKPTTVTRTDMELYIEHLMERYKASTVKRKIAALKAYYHYLVYEEILEHSPFEKIQLHIRQEILLPRTIDRPILGAIFSAAYRELSTAHSKAARRETIRNIAVLELLFASGIRVSELCTITCDNLNLDSQVVLIRGKGSKERKIYRCHILHNPIYRNTLYSMNQAIDLFHDTFVIEGDLVLARNIFSRQDNSFYYVMRYPQCGEDAWHPILEGEQITSFQIGYSNEPCLLGVSFWAQKDCPLVKSVLREYFTEENFKNDSIFWDDCITSVLRQIPIRVREVSSSDACEMNTGIEYKFAQEMCSKYFQNCLPFILDYGREQAIRSHRLNFVEDIDSCTQWQEQLLDYLGDKSQEGNLSRNPTVFTCGEFPFMAKDTQTGDYVAYFDVAEASHYILLRRLFVAQEARRHGIGSEIVRYIKLYAKLSNKELRVNVYDADAEQFYRKLGMKPYFKTLRFPMEDLL